MQVRRQIETAKARGETDLAKIVDRNISDLETRILQVMRDGVISAATVSVGREHLNDPAVISAMNKQQMENERLVKEALIPNIHINLREKVNVELESREILESFNTQRSLTAQYAGGFWVMIFNVQQSAGLEKERQMKAEGLPVEPVRWVLDPSADHCHPSPGYYGCIELAGEYPGGWSTLRTVPAGQVTCRGRTSPRRGWIKEIVDAP